MPAFPDKQHRSTLFTYKVAMVRLERRRSMGIRMDQYRGLNHWAARLASESERTFAYLKRETRFYPDGRVERVPDILVYQSAVRIEPSGRYYRGMFGDQYALNKYTLPDGTVYYEGVQAEPWSSGPVFFLALKDEKGNWVPESLWSEEEIENA